MKNTVFLIGTGEMAIEYARVIKALKYEIVVVGRGVKSAQNFQSKTGIEPHIGGLDLFLNSQDIDKNSYVIIATGTEQLMPLLLTLLKKGLFKILIEKPAALTIQELILHENEFIKGEIFVAYNRRFYSSVMEAKNLIQIDGGLESMNFEFTEWAHQIEDLPCSKQVKNNWFFLNSTHVIDLAFYFGGMPIEWSAFYKNGNLSWHKQSMFSGAGLTNNNVIFSYKANWESAGRWGLELLTKKRKIILTPLEKVYIQNRGSILISEHQINDSLDIEYKPGLFLQTKSFLENRESESLIEINEHIKMTKIIYFKMLNKK
jgi:predicted dehydrogenase